MRCRYCNIALAPSRSFVDGEFCCDDHRQRFESESPSGIAVTKHVTQHLSAAFERLRQTFVPHRPHIDAEVTEAEIAVEEGVVESTLAAPELASTTIPEEQPIFAESLDEAGPSAHHQSEEGASATRANPAQENAASWRWLITAWRGAPRDLKLVSLLLPFLLVVAITGSLPKVPITTTGAAESGPGANANAEGGRRSVEDHESKPSHRAPRWRTPTISAPVWMPGKAVPT